jgi:hypothetical protein
MLGNRDKMIKIDCIPIKENPAKIKPEQKLKSQITLHSQFTPKFLV